MLPRWCYSTHFTTTGNTNDQSICSLVCGEGHNDAVYKLCMKKCKYIVHANNYRTKARKFFATREASINSKYYREVHYCDVIMDTMESQITSLTIVYLTVYSDTDQRKHQSSASLAFVRGIHRGSVNSRTNGKQRGKCFHLMTSSCDANDWF